MSPTLDCILRWVFVIECAAIVILVIAIAIEDWIRQRRSDS